MPRALITGIDGQDGRHLAELLISKGYETFGMIRGQANPRAQLVQDEIPEVELIEGDLQDLSSLIAVVEQVQPEQLLSYRWHPYAVEPGVDYADEPTTLVEFHLADVADGTQLTVVESGFDRIPPERRATAFRMNDQGWAEQLTHIARYVAA